MKIIIVGCGRVGQTLAEKLNMDGNDVTVVDMQAAKVNAITSRIDVMGVVGNGATYTTQREAGVEHADLLIAVTDSDELNLLCCIVAKKEGSCQTIARIRNSEYSTDSAYLKEQLGLAMVINPEYAAAEEISRVLRFPSAVKIEPFAKGKVELIKFQVTAPCKLIGMTVKEVVTKFRTDVLFATIERGEDAYIANGDSVFMEKDVVSIVALTKRAKDFFEKIDYAGHSVKNALVLGGGRITHYLCEILEKSGISLKVIEKDLKACEELSNQWGKVDVIHGNPADRELLLEEGLERAGAVVALCSLDEENILHSLFAKDKNNAKLVTKINRIDYDSVLQRLDLDTVICPKNITADIIMRYVRAMGNAQGSNIENLYNIIQDKVEAAEFIVKAESPVVGSPLSQLKFKENVLVASILRNKAVILPRGYDVIEEGDRVVVVTKGLALHDIADVLR